MRVPFIKPNHHWLEHKQDYIDIMSKVLDSGQYQGDKVTKDFEDSLQEYTGRKFAVAVNSGSDALVLALKALQYPPGSEILVPAFSFVATASAVVCAGHVPVFCDVTPDGIINSIYNRITEKTKAIILVTMFGNYGALPDIDDIPAGIGVICDNAQGFGQMSCRYSNLNCLSFDPMKTLPAFGSGGAILTDEPLLAFFMKGLRKNDPGTAVASQNSQMSALTAAFLRYKLDYHDEWTYVLHRHALRYTNGLEGCPIQIRRHLTGRRSNHKYVIRCTDGSRDRLKHHLKAVGIETKIHYPYVLPELEMFGKPLFPSQIKQQYPFAKALSEEALSLPIYPSMSEDDIDYVCEKIVMYYRYGNS